VSDRCALPAPSYRPGAPVRLGNWKAPDYKRLAAGAPPHV